MTDVTLEEAHRTGESLEKVHLHDLMNIASDGEEVSYPSGLSCVVRGYCGGHSVV